MIDFLIPDVGSFHIRRICVDDYCRCCNIHSVYADTHCRRSHTRYHNLESEGDLYRGFVCDLGLGPVSGLYL